jgi:hypothetical protein
MPTISQELCNEAASLIYRKWSEAYGTLKKVKEEQNDGSKDWPLFHRERLRRAIVEEAQAKVFLDEIQHLHTIGR